MPPPALDFARLQAPDRHAATLIEPAATHWARLVHENRRQLAALKIRVFDLPIATVRAQTRALFGVGPDQPLILTGHQPGLNHPGVWIKQVLATRLAAAVHGLACNLVVDQDVPKSPAIDLPFVDAEGHRLGPAVCVAALPGIAYEGLPPADHRILEDLEERVQACGIRNLDQTLMPGFLSAMRQGVGGDDWVQQTMTACRSIDATMDADISDRRVSRIFGGALLGEIILEAPRFADAYNGALADYRKRFRVRSLQHPMPDLARHGDRWETPLWIYRPDQPRQRMYVERRGDDCLLYADDAKVGVIRMPERGDIDTLHRQLAALAPRVIRPRALLLTLWARLLAADLFIHGIGGAKYDRVTDGVISRYFGVAAPAMVCASATLHLDLGRSIADGPDPVRCRRQVRDHWHNPQRYVNHPEVASLEEAKRSGIDEIRRLRALGRQARSDRRRLFESVRSANAKIRELDPAPRLAALAALGEALQKRSWKRVMQHREFFYALHPRATLQSLLDQLPQVQDFS